MGRIAWTDKDEDFIRKNIHLSNHELADKMGRSLASVENKVRELGLARIFQNHEVEILREVWGSKRAVIAKALPRFTWRQISKKANNLGLPPLKDVRAEANLYSILVAMGEPDSMGVKWRAAGLIVKNDKLRHMKNNILVVDIEHFWKFALKHPELVDYTKLGDNVLDVLGVPPDALIKRRKTAVPLEPRNKHKTLRGAKREALARTYYASKQSASVVAKDAGVSVDTLRHIASEYRAEGQRRKKRPSVVNDAFLRKLSQLYYVECRSYAECAEALGCSKSSVSRGILKLAKTKSNM